MKFFKVAAAELNQTPMDWEGNLRHIRKAIEMARAEDASVLCLPELCITGYGCEDAFLSKSVADTALDVLLEAARSTQSMVVSFGLPLLHRNTLFNAACLVVDGKIEAFVAKRHLAGQGIHYEPRWFRPWPEGVRAEVEVGKKVVPMGDLVIDCGGIRIGFEICEDAWAADRPATDLATYGVDLILNPSASHFAFGKAETRRRLVVEGTRAFGVSYVYSNLLGNEAGRAIYDGGSMIASRGTILASGSRFSFEDVKVISATIDLDATRMDRARNSAYKPELDSHSKLIVNTQFEPTWVQPQKEDLVEPSWETGNFLKEEEFVRAEALGLFDYLRKSHSRGFVVSLSGGADSAACACLVSTMVGLGVGELGADEFAKKIPAGDRLQGLTDPREIAGHLLTCVYQATANSSDTTRTAAKTVAHGIGARFVELDVEPLVKKYVDMISAIEHRELTWSEDDLSLQNIQARVRAPGVWMLANLHGALLLSTSNRSEAAVGYATMDGDTCGGLSPIAGIDKAYLRKWLVWMETTGPQGVGPIPQLNLVNAQQPTAELRPQEQGQTDEDDLMPYELLDAIERAAIRDKRSPVEVFELMRLNFPSLPMDRLGTWVERFFRLWAANQWKRERYAPSFHLDDENLDPKTWCRFPILSGGFARELVELRKRVGATGRSPLRGPNHDHWVR